MQLTHSRVQGLALKGFLLEELTTYLEIKLSLTTSMQKNCS